MRGQLIGIDASRAITPAPTGTETYSRELVRALLSAESPFRFRLYTRAQPPPDLFPPTGNYELRVMPFPRLWSLLRLSVEMLARPPDWLFVPAHVLPPVHPRRSLVTVHDVGYLRFPQAHPLFARRYLDLSTRWNVRAASVVLVDSEATRSDLASFYRVDPQKVLVVHPALSTSFHGPVPTAADVEDTKRKYGLASRYILSVGTLQPRKNYSRLLQALADLPADLKLVLVGKRGWLSDAISAAIQEAQDRVCWLDYVPTQELRRLYAGAEAFVFPSLYEGFGLPILEAQSCGAPVACSNSSSLPEVAGEAAEFFDPLVPGDIARAVRLILTDPARRAQLIELGRRNISRFTWEAAARTVLDVIR